MLQRQAVVQKFYGDPVKSREMPGLAAIINNRQITMRELAEECIERHGVDVLDGTINRHLLQQSLHAKNFTITQQDIDAEIARAAIAMGKTTAGGKADVAAWIEVVTHEQHITYDLYVRDAVWPSVTLKKLCGDIKVTNDDMHRGFEANYGQRVKCRVIVLNNLRNARSVFLGSARVLLKHPDHGGDFFGQLAEQYSIDPSRSVQGRVPPIQKWGGLKELEDQAFSLDPGKMSGIVQVNDNYVILFCEGYTPSMKVTLNDPTIRRELYDDIHEKNSAIAMAEAFTHLKDAAQIDNYLAQPTQSPKLARRQPTVRQAVARPMANRRPPAFTTMCCRHRRISRSIRPARDKRPTLVNIGAGLLVFLGRMWRIRLSGGPAPPFPCAGAPVSLRVEP